MSEFLFVWDRVANAWPLRYLVSRGGPVSVPTDVPIEGVVSAAASEHLIAQLRGRYPVPRYRVARMSATSWDAVVENFPGLCLD